MQLSPDDTVFLLLSYPFTIGNWSEACAALIISNAPQTNKKEDYICNGQGIPLIRIAFCYLITDVNFLQTKEEISIKYQ